MSINSSGSITFIPISTFVGTLNYNYSVCDPFTCTSGIISISVSQGTVSGSNNPPTATNLTFSGFKNLAISGTITGFEDIDNELLTVRLLTTGTGLMSLNANGRFTYIPVPNFTGLNVKYYSVCDPHQACVTAQIVFSIAGGNVITTLSSIVESNTEPNYVYPNPSFGIIKIDANSNEVLLIYNLVGEKLFSKTMQIGINTIDISYLPKGIYFYSSGLNKGKLLLTD